ncbi:MAG: hypothetical protein M3Q27_09415 [Actinomycetota bacterium]|nr:hypothetical protein [Actinomycetota bacterium]
MDIVAALVRHHLLLVETATRRDLDDPATARYVADLVGTEPVLDLLHTLTEADALATGPTAWSPWRAQLVADLVTRVRAVLGGQAVAPVPALLDEHRDLLDTTELEVRLAPDETGWTVTVAAPDRRGLMASVTGVLALHRLSVRAATLHTEGGVAVDRWSVVPAYGDPPELDRLRTDLRAALDGTLDVAKLLARREASGGRDRTSTGQGVLQRVRVDVVEGASLTATVLEVRAPDRPALLHRLGRVLTLAGVDVRAARVATLGGDAVDVFYVVDEPGGPLSDSRAREVARVLRDAAG